MIWSKLLVASILFLLSTSVFCRDKGFALSGGVSLGSYEAGVFYTLINQDRANIARETKIVFGTSAGSINSLIGIFDICTPSSKKISDDLLWKMWIPIGVDQLEAKSKKESALFDRHSSEPLFKELRARWKQGFHQDCDLHFGVAVARRFPYVDEIKPGLEIIRQSEFFFVHIKGQGPGRYPLVENQKYSNINSYRSYLPVGESPEKDLEILLGLIQASSSFPGAFSPYPIHFCYSQPGEAYKGCKSSETTMEYFIDGGLYHNGPVGYAYEGMIKTSKDKNFSLHYINAGSPLAGQKQEQVNTKKPSKDVFKDFHDLFFNFITQARKFELDKSLESNPNIVKHLETEPKQFPLVSEPLYAFTGFLETDFRKSDFYLGINDGERSGLIHKVDGNSEYHCFKERLVKDSKCSIDHNMAVLANLAKHRVAKKLTDPDFDYVYDYLEEHKFAFKDLDLEKNESHYGKIYTKKRLTKLLSNFSKRQPEERSHQLSYAIRPSLNYLKYTPPDQFWWANYASTPEIGFSTLLPEKYLGTYNFRFDLAAMIPGFDNFFSRDQDIWGIAPMAGIEYEPVWINSATWQWRTGIRGGYVLSPRDKLGQEDCDEDLAEKSPGACSGVTAQLFVALSVLERLRMQLVYVPLLVDSIQFDDRPEIILQLGFQFGGSL